MATHYRTQGIFLRKSVRGEADEILTIYTKDFGKLRVLGKAIRKITSKLGGGAEIFYLSEIEFIQGKTSKTLTDVIPIDRFSNIRNALGKLRVACKIAESLDVLVAKEEKDEQVWGLLNEVFQKLNGPRLPIAGCQLLYYYFFWNLVSILGYRPDISGCSLRGKEINCDIVRILKVILRKDWQILSRLKLEPIHQELLKNTSEWYTIEVYGFKK